MGRLVTPGRSLRLEAAAFMVMVLAGAHGTATGALAVNSTTRTAHVAAASTESGTIEVRALDNAFEPTSLRVPAGSSLTLVNVGRAPHTLTAVDRSFDSGIISAGGAWIQTFDVPGTYPFLCILHPGMEGLLEVVAPESGEPPTPSAPRPGQKDSLVVNIEDDAFRPPGLTIEVGTTVRWINRGIAPHTVTDPAGSFDSRLLSTGDSWSREFTEPGTYAIFCVVHPEMTGNIQVIATQPSMSPRATPDGAAPTASATVDPAASSGSTDPGHGAGGAAQEPPGSSGRFVPIPVLIFGAAIVAAVVAMAFFVRAVTDVVDVHPAARPALPGNRQDR